MSNSEDISDMRIAIAGLVKDYTTLRRDHDKIDVELTAAYKSMSTSVSLISGDIKIMKNTVVTFLVGAALGYGALNWENILKIIT